MSIGSAVRAILPPSLERRAAGAYRSVFVDLQKVAVHLATCLQKDARLLDVGGGDGELLNYLLDLRADVSVSMVDVAETIGKFVQQRHFSRVEVFPGTSLEAHLAGADPYDAVLVSDVMHHLPESYRAKFLFAARTALVPNGLLFIKDIEPGHWRSSLSLLCDRHVSGDRGVSLVSQDGIRRLLQAGSACDVSEVGLYEDDCPNYILKCDFGA